MSVLDRKLRRELRASWLLLSAITSIIVVGVACYVTMGSAYNNLTEAKRRYYRQCRMADFWIDLKKVPLAELDQVAELSGVAEIRPRIQFFATVDLDEATGPANRVTAPVNGLVLSLPDRREPVLNDVVLRRGSYFTDRRQNEVIVNDAFARQHKLRPGQWIHLALNNRRQELFIVGTAISSEFVYLLGPGAIVPDPEHFGIFYLKRSYAEDVFDFNGAANQLLGRLTPDARRHPQELLDRAERQLASYGVFATTPLADQPSNMYLSLEIAGLRVFAWFLPCVFLAVAAVVLNVLLTRLAQQQRTVVGTLKALGYSDRQLFMHFLKFGLTVGLAGGLIGCASGYWLAELLTIVYREFFEFPDLNNRFYPAVQGIALLISLVCAVLGSLRGTRAVLRLQPAAAMRPKPPRRGGAVFLERAGLDLVAAQLRLADGPAGLDPQPRADRRRGVRRLHGRQPAGQRLHDDRGHRLPGRLPVQVDPQERLRADLQGRAERGRGAGGGPAAGGRPGGTDLERALHLLQRPVSQEGGHFGARSGGPAHHPPRP